MVETDGSLLGMWYQQRSRCWALDTKNGRVFGGVRAFGMVVGLGLCVGSTGQGNGPDENHCGMPTYLSTFLSCAFKGLLLVWLICACTATEELIFNTSSEHQTVDLSIKCMTKDFLRDFRHGCTVDGGQETAPLTCICQWIREGAELSWYMWGCVRRKAAQRKHKGTSFPRSFRSSALMTGQNH
jgi:hypothetical protein